MWPQRRPKLSAELENAELAIAAMLRGGDSLPAWNAVWDLMQSSDGAGTREILDALRDFANTPPSSPATERAAEFHQAIEQSLNARPGSVVASREVQQHQKRAQIESHNAAMRRAGVRPGEGIPMWMMYMTRRSKRSWR